MLYHYLLTVLHNHVPVDPDPWSHWGGLSPMYRLSDFWVMRSRALRLAAPQARRQREFQRALQRMVRDAQNNANNQDDDNNDDHNDDNNDDNNDDDNNGNGNDNSGNGKPRVDPEEAARRQRALDYLHNESRCLQTQDNNDPAEHICVQRLILQEMMRVEAHGSISLNNHNHNGNNDVDDQDDVEAVDESDENNDENNIVVYTEQQQQQYEAIAAALGFTTPRTLSQKTLLQRVIAWCERKK
jgi:hypothetical protein